MGTFWLTLPNSLSPNTRIVQLIEKVEGYDFTKPYFQVSTILWSKHKLFHHSEAHA